MAVYSVKTIQNHPLFSFFHYISLYVMGNPRASSPNNPKCSISEHAMAI